MNDDKERAAAMLTDVLDRLQAGADIGDLLGADLDPTEVARLSTLAASAPATTWVGVNGSRVDVVVSDKGDEWRVVFGTEDGRRIDWLHTYRRPPHFPGVPGGRAVVVNGPSGAGKSTLLKSLQRSARDVPWVIVDEPEDVGSVRSEYLIWLEQTPTLQEGYLAAIGALVGAGNLVAVAAGGRAQADFSRHVQNTPTVWVGLYCDADVLLARERSRTDRWGGLAEASRSVHDGWQYDLTFDTTDSPDPADLAADILREVEAGAAVKPAVVRAPVLADGTVRLDGFQMSDAAAHLAGEDQELAQRFGWFPEQSTVESVRSAIERWQRGWEVGGPVRALAVRRVDDGRLVGGVELRVEEDAVASISYWVSAGFRRQGFASRAVRLLCRYAMTELDVERIEALIEPDNLGSLRTVQRVGFEVEGRLRGRGRFGAERRDMLLLGLLPADLND